MILIFGAPRSGTSWLGKILDSHPDTLLRHEPDTVDRGGEYPSLPDARHAQAARRHLTRLVRCNRLKPAGSRPVFPKSYWYGPERLLRLGWIYTFKAAERYLHPAFGRVRVPDFVDPARAEAVIKSVGLGRVGAWTAAMPEAKTVIIVRHPCGHVASVLRGREAGLLQDEIPLAFAETDEARAYGLTREALAEAGPVIQAAWRWAILNERAMAAAPNAKIVRYEDLCADPVGVSREIVAFCGLSWSDAIADFISASTAGDGSFFQTRRDPLVAAERWRQEFQQAQTVIRAIAHTEPARLFDLAADQHEADRASVSLVDAAEPDDTTLIPVPEL